jgi:hypothetical protein
VNDFTIVTACGRRAISRSRHEIIPGVNAMTATDDGLLFHIHRLLFSLCQLIADDMKLWMTALLLMCCMSLHAKSALSSK